jgi:hypothetical protein
MTMQKMRIHNRSGRSVVVCTLSLVCGLAAGNLQAQKSQHEQKPVSKVAVQFVGTNIVAQTGPDGPGYQDLVSAQVQTVQTNALLVNVGLELTLQTTSTPGSSEFELLEVEVLVDGNFASPDVVRFGDQNARQSPGETDSFLLERQNAVSFSFLTGDLTPGLHTILVKAYLVGSGVGGGAHTGSVGKGTMTVETVHVITDPSDIPTLN